MSPYQILPISLLFYLLLWLFAPVKVQYNLSLYAFSLVSLMFITLLSGIYFYKFIEKKTFTKKIAMKKVFFVYLIFY